MPIPNEIEIFFDESKPPIRCHSLEEVDSALDCLHRDAGTTPLAVAIKVFGHEIDTGLGTDLTFVCLQIEPCDGEYYLAVGDQTAEATVTFRGAGGESYWQLTNLVPLATARAGVRYFIEHQQRIPSVRWQDWRGQDTT